MKHIKLFLFSAVCLIALITLCVVLFVFADSRNVRTLALYFKNSTGNGMEFENRIIQQTDNSTEEEIFESVLAELKNGPKSNTSLQDVFGDVIIEESSLSLSDKTAYISLSLAYYDKVYSDRLLLESCIVYTLTELEFIDNVSISSGGRNIGGQELLNRKNVLWNPDIAPEKINYRSITLYFTDSDFRRLLPEQRLIEVKQSQDIEFSVVEQLLAGPQDSKLSTAIPLTAKLINTTTENGICYVNLSSEFMNKGGGAVLTELQVYQIVNSLTELDGVDSVQIYIEGQKVNEGTGDVDISKELERNERLIKKN